MRVDYYYIKMTSPGSPVMVLNTTNEKTENSPFSFTPDQAMYTDRSTLVGINRLTRSKW